MDNKQITKRVQTLLTVLSGTKILYNNGVEKISEDEIEKISKSIEKDFEYWWVRNDADTFYYQSFLNWLIKNYKQLIK
ncbi:MAG: hypothetical protein PHC28_07825 [Flavobacterium sp.]|uniref:hypothetical protein n=1 Tax=Flavobacterium sp. TaxID=239 RepID=UPI0026048FA3|nr:hypothetical protein [Flavobacterium sp.]MDD5150380.1 hypothetical protein [Flavobacterium sp.]